MWIRRIASASAGAIDSTVSLGTRRASAIGTRVGADDLQHIGLRRQPLDRRAGEHPVRAGDADRAGAVLRSA